MGFKICGIVIIFFLVISSSFSFVSCGEDIIVFMFQGPAYTEDHIVLTNFVAIGPSELQMGDTLNVSFTFTNGGQTPIQFTDKGVFLAFQNQEISSGEVGNMFENQQLGIAESVSFSSALILSTEGLWSIWPSYEIWDDGQKKQGPDFWHSYNFSLGVVDLEVVDILYFPELPTEGQQISLKPVIHNTGSAASNSCEGSFYIDNEFIGLISIGTLESDSSTVGEAISWTPSERGVYAVRFWVDSSQDNFEVDEENNNYTIEINVGGEDPTFPRLSVYYTPETVTERDEVTFFACAVDESGIDYILISGYTTPSYQYFSKMCNDTTYCNLTVGPFSRLETVHYYVQSRDLSGNLNQTPEETFIVESFYHENLTVSLSISPEYPTETDEIFLTGEASYPYGIKYLKILNYKWDNYTLASVENSTVVTFGPLGPFMPGTRLKYWAMAEDIDGHIAYSSVVDVTVGELPEAVNEKSLGSYHTREVFLISDLDWRAVLSLVPISVWRELDGTTVNYPVLIYHQEKDGSFDADAVLHFLQQYQGTGISRNQLHVTVLGNPPEDLLELLVAPEPVGAFLEERQVTLWRAPSSGESSTILRLDMSPMDVEELRTVLDSKWGFSFELTSEGTSGIVPMADLYSDAEEQSLRGFFWDEINLYVVSQDEYATGLMASVFASYMNAPLVFQGHYNIADLQHKHVYLIGEFSETEMDSFRSVGINILYRFHLNNLSNAQDIRRHYAIATGTNKVILVNPLDLWLNHRRDYTTDRGSTVSFLYCKQSLAAPFLAAAKHEVILSTTLQNYPEIDQFIMQSFNQLPYRGPLTYLTLIAAPDAIPIARPNAGCPAGIHENLVCYESSRYGDVDIVRTTVSGITDTFITMDRNFQFNPVCSDKVIAWVDEATWGDIWYMDRDTGDIRRLTGASEVLASQQHPAVHDDIIVWQDSRHLHTTEDGIDILGTNHQTEIYMYDTSSKSRRRITISNASQQTPDIWGDSVVWQDNRNGLWDIYLYEIDSGRLLQITDEPHNQEQPAISFNKIVYSDDRNGNWDIYFSWLGLGGDYVAGERRVTSDSRIQRYPCIYRDYIVWQDNRHGNWDIYMYDISLEREYRLTTESIDQVLPSIWEDTILWKERSDEGWWYICAYDIPTGSYKRITRTEVSADSGPLWLEIDGRYFGSSENLRYQDIATGRIYGITVSDVSAYIARAVFFVELSVDRDALVIVREDHQPELDHIHNGYYNEAVLEDFARSMYWTADVENEFSDGVAFYSGVAEVSSNSARIADQYDEHCLIVYVDHGGTESFQDTMNSNLLCSNHIYLEPVTILDLACLTGAYYARLSNGETPTKLFATQNIRRGAMVYMGATDVSYWHRMFDTLLYSLYIEGKTIGEAYVEARNEEYDEDNWNFSVTLRGDIFYTLHGDPTFQPRWWS